MSLLHVDVLAGAASFPANFGLPNVKGMYRYRIMCLICRFIVMQNNVMKYMTRIGQKTGMLKKSKNVHTNAMTVAFVAEYQNLNSGNLKY